MMHHPNMHHQPLSGHPPQHMAGHQNMPGHHQIPPHQIHRENRHVALARVPLGPSGAAGAMGGHGQAMGGIGAMGVHHPQSQRPPHPIRAMAHHPQQQHHSVPPQQIKIRRPYGVGGGYSVGGSGVMPPPFAPHHTLHAPQPTRQPPHHHQPHSVVSTSSSHIKSNATNTTEQVGTEASGPPPGVPAASANSAGVPVAQVSAVSSEDAATGDNEAARPDATSANSKEKTPMCLVNELARYNKIKHQYRLTSETGPAHKKIFTVTLRLGDTEEYTAEGSSIKRAQHAAASAALTATSFRPPPPRAPPAHSAAHPHHRHSGAVMPTVELNALAMKLCQPAVYTSVPSVSGPTRFIRPRAPPYRGHALMGAFPTPAIIYRVRVAVGGRAWLGEGPTPQAARHDAAARALHELRPPSDQVENVSPPADNEAGEANAELLNSEVKSPVSLVHELALKRNLSVGFSVKSERGPPHMRVFVTTCTVGDMETEGEGNGKKVSKRRAAERMLDEMRRRWPPALLRTRPPTDKRRYQPTKKKPRNLIKEGGTAACTSGSGADNPISRLAVARHAARARSPQYRVLEERGAARRREFIVQCDAPPHSATGLGPNKKTAKRRAAHNVLLAMEMGTQPSESAATPSANAIEPNINSADGNKCNMNTDIKRKEGEMRSNGTGGGANSDVRQPVPGVLMMDYHQRSGQPNQPNGVSESSATGASGVSQSGARAQLMYLAKLLGFSVQFSDFPKRNHGEYLSLVSLSTVPPVMCHGGGASTEHSHEQCSRAALKALALMGLDAPAPGPANAATVQSATDVGQLNALVNGISE